MRNRLLRAVFALLLLLPLLPVFAADDAKPAAPPLPTTRREAVTETLHGVAVSDPYRWLEAQDAPETRAWIDAQNAYTQSLIGTLASRDSISRRLTELMKVDVVNAPTERNGRYLFSARSADQDLNVLHMKRGIEGKDEVLLDPHALSPDHTTSIAMMGLSHDANTLFYG